MIDLQPLPERAVAISVSESPDLPGLGLTAQHLRDATVAAARHILGLGVELIYGGHLREHGFGELLFDTVTRYRREDRLTGRLARLTNYLAWPVHISTEYDDLEALARQLEGCAALICLRPDGSPISLSARRKLPTRRPSVREWSLGLNSMRRTASTHSDARVLLGGSVTNYRGSMPGVAEEALLSLRARQPLFLVGGFGGCTYDITRALGLTQPSAQNSRDWPGLSEFDAFSAVDLRNGLTPADNLLLARTPHIHQALVLLLRGLHTISQR